MSFLGQDKLPAWMAFFGQNNLLNGLPLDETAAFNLQRFDNLATLARTLPSYLLHVSRHGAFWQEIERVIRA